MQLLYAGMDRVLDEDLQGDLQMGCTGSVELCR